MQGEDVALDALMNLAVGFDFDHTLGVDGQLERTVGLERLAADAAARGTPFDATLAAAAVDPALAAFRQGTLVLDAALRSAGIDPPAFRERALQRCAEFVRPLPGARETLLELEARGIAFALLTNGWSPLQEAKARCVGFTGPVIVSELAGVRKPERAAFALLAEVLNVPAAGIVYVGDDPAVDVAGSLAAGMKAAWFDWEGHAYPASLPQPTWRITALAELPALLVGQAFRAANPAL